MKARWKEILELAQVLNASENNKAKPTIYKNIHKFPMKFNWYLKLKKKVK